MSWRLSIPSSSTLWCLSVPSFSTVPPNRLNWTVILVVMAGSMMAASSWAAKILRGLSQKSFTEMNLLSQILCSLLRARSLSSSKEMLYLGTITGSEMNFLKSARIWRLSWSSRAVILGMGKLGESSLVLISSGVMVLFSLTMGAADEAVRQELMSTSFSITSFNKRGCAWIDEGTEVALEARAKERREALGTESILSLA